jgi:dTDP-glucose 4,6-dehydratase
LPAEVVERILEHTGADPSLIRHVEDRAGHDRRYALDCSKLRALGWSSRHSFDQALEKTVRWYVEHGK